MLIALCMALFFIVIEVLPVALKRAGIIASLIAVLAITTTIGILGFVFDRILLFVEKLLTRWK